MAEFYSRNLSREIMKRMKQRAHEGHLVFRPAFGYRREVVERQEGAKRTQTISKSVLDENTAPIVKRIFELFDIVKEIRVRDKQVTLSIGYLGCHRSWPKKSVGDSSLQYRGWWSQ
jgi:hypothetical protein